MKKFWNKLKENDYVIIVSNSKASLIFSCFMMLVALLFYFVLTPQWVSGKSQFGPSPQMVPNLLTIGVFVCALVFFLTELRVLQKRKRNAGTTQNREPKEAAEGAKKEADFFDQFVEHAKEDAVTIDLRGLGFILAAVAACVFYVLCVDYLGFILVMAINVTSLLLLYGVRKPLTIIVTSSVMSVGVYFAFTKLLSLVLPSGMLF
jgi:hypothetical protein